MLCGALSLKAPSLSLSQTESAGTASDATFWSTYVTEKVLQDRPSSEYSPKTAKIDVLSAKGEYEAGQIIITAPEDKSLKYEIELSDLSTTGGIIFSKEKIEEIKRKSLEKRSDR